jgi:hypothetical protein
VLWSPLIALVLPRIRGYKIAFWIAGFLIIASTFYILRNETRPLIEVRPNSTVFSTSRIDQVFKQFSDVKDAYLTAAELVETQKCSALGLDLGEYDLEYPFWVLLHKTNRQPMRIEHANVTNISAKFTANPFADFSPCAVIAVRRGRDNAEAISEGSMYTKAWSSGPVRVFVKRRAFEERTRLGGG